MIVFPAIDLKQGLQIGDVTAFRGTLIILPERQGKTPIVSS